MTTLTYNSEVIELPYDILFSNEPQFSSQYTQVQSQSLDGIVIIEEWLIQTGKSIVLEGSESRAWIDASTKTKLLTLSQIPGAKMTLTLSDTRTFQVMFDRQDNRPIEFRELFDVYPTDDTDIFWIKLKFVTVD